jgi:geranylgeranyl diphosphate synthase, type II
MTIDLRQHLDERRRQVESHLRQMLSYLDGSPTVLREAVEYSLLASGKRLRPLLTILGAEACGGSIQNALPAACSVEMIHTYSLIHDDLPAMDDDELRRGRPTCHKKYSEALAILAGDTLLTLSFQVLAIGYPPPAAAACARELAIHAGAIGMVGGQVDDLAWAGKISGSKVSESLSVLQSIHARKTGALFVASMRLGLLVAQGAEPDPGVREKLDEYARCFGLAFQITDDLLDVEGDATALGKGVRKDAKRGKLTFPGLLGKEKSRERAETLCHQAVQAVKSFGASGEPLAELVGAMLVRDR